MTALQVNSMKQFMAQLLTTEAFDIFLLVEASVSAANTVTIDGRRNKDFFPEEEASLQAPGEAFTPWGNLKGLCYFLMKGKRTPLAFKFVFHLKPSLAEKLLKRDGAAETDSVQALVLTVRYNDGSKAILTTGVSYRTFVASKEAEGIWDRALERYLTQKGIATERL